MASTSVAYTGRWHDWSYGPTWGDRVTMSSSNAQIMIAFIAIFDAYVGGMAWNLFNFLIHQRRATKQPRDGLHHQLQVLLRNSTEPISFTVQALQAGWKWRGRAPRARRRALAISILPVVTSVLFAVAGIFSSQIASTGDVLLVGGNCGIHLQYFAQSTTADDLDYEAGYFSEAGIVLGISNAYAQTCYSNPRYGPTAETVQQFSPGASCNVFVKPFLEHTAMSGASCPFQQACNVPDTGILTLDTGYLSSHDHLGLNQPPENRILFRRINTCSPMTTDGFSTNSFEEVESFSSIGNISTYNYGGNFYQPQRRGYPSGLPYPDTTFVYSYDEYVGNNHPYYLLAASTMYLVGTESVFKPLPTISNDTLTPVSLFFLGNRALSLEEEDDPWFSATTPYISEVGLMDSGGNLLQPNYTLWYQTNPGTVLGCVEQAQFCNPNIENACTDLNQWYTWGRFSNIYKDPSNYTFITDPYPKGLGCNSVQAATLMAIQTALLGSQAYAIVQRLGPQALLASNYIQDETTFLSWSVGYNSWQNEATNWFRIGLAVIQRSIIANWRESDVAPFQESWVPFKQNDTAEQNICANQKVKNPAYQSFSVTALVINFTIGGLIIISSAITIFIVPTIQKRFGNTVAREQWRANNVLRLQKAVYEAEGQGDWEDADDDIPVTKKGQLLKPAGLRSNSDQKLAPTGAYKTSSSRNPISKRDKTDQQLHYHVRSLPQEDTELSDLASSRNLNTYIPSPGLNASFASSSPLIAREDLSGFRDHDDIHTTSRSRASSVSESYIDSS